MIAYQYSLLIAIDELHWFASSSMQLMQFGVSIWTSGAQVSEPTKVLKMMLCACLVVLVGGSITKNSEIWP